MHNAPAAHPQHLNESHPPQRKAASNAGQAVKVPPQQAAILLNEAAAAALLGIGRRKFHALRIEPWFSSVCTAIELGPRALRWHRDELAAALRNAPRRVVQAEPEQLLRQRIERLKGAA
jgi:hypothetical protein